MEHKTFFEKYQTFISIIIAGALIGGGIVLSKTIPGNAQPAADQGAAQTFESVKQEMLDAGKKVGISTKKLEACLDDGTFEQKINDDMELAQKSGVNGTPTFFVIKRTFGLVEKDNGSENTVIDEKQFSVIGARDQATFLKAIAEGKSPADQGGDVQGEKIVLTENDHWYGPRDAEVVIVEYSDIDCPFCKRAKPIIDQMLIEHPEFAFVYRHAPILSLHPFAGLKAEATECVKSIGGDEAFWKFLDIVAI